MASGEWRMANGAFTSVDSPLQSYNPTILLLAFVIGSHGNNGKRQTQKMGGKQNLSACIRAGALADNQGGQDLHERGVAWHCV